MKKNSHLYNSLGDYAEPYRSIPNWKIALQQVAIYTLISIGLVASGLFVITFVEFIFQ